IAQAFGVENVYLLRYVTDEEFAEKCEEMLADKKMTGADILAWCDYMESIEDNRPQLYRSTHVSIKDVRDKSNGKIDSKQVTSTAKYCSDDVSEDSTLRVPWLSDFFVEVGTVCSSSIMMSDVETALIAADSFLTVSHCMDKLSLTSVFRFHCLRSDSTAKLKDVKR
ncbi:hypothetical protein FOZ62_009315, partial [Perkinsus olseni]